MEIAIQSIEFALQLIDVRMVIERVIVYIHCCAIFIALYNLGHCFKEKGMLDKAISTLEECLAAECSFLPVNHPSIGTSEFAFVIHCIHLMTFCLCDSQHC